PARAGRVFSARAHEANVSESAHLSLRLLSSCARCASGACGDDWRVAELVSDKKPASTRLGSDCDARYRPSGHCEARPALAKRIAIEDTGRGQWPRSLLLFSHRNGCDGPTR